MKKKKIRFNLIFLLLIACIVSCSMLPKPQSDNETLLILPIKTIKKANCDFFRHYIIELENTDEIIRIDPQSGYMFVRNLQPGKYTATKLISLHRGHVRRREFDLNIPFSLSARTITIFPCRLEVLLRKEYREMKSNYYQYWEFYKLSTREKKNIIEDIKKHKSIEYWRIQEN